MVSLYFGYSNMSDNTTLLEDVEFIHSTDAAILIEFDGGDTVGPVEGVNRFWIPKSVIIDLDLMDFTEAGDIADLEIKSWFVANCDGLEDAIEERS